MTGSNVTKAIIPVAGLGTRMLPASKAVPKELLPILNKPIIQYVVEEAIEAGIKEIFFVTNSSKKAIENHFDSNFYLEKSLEKSKKKKLLDTIKNIIPKKISIASIIQNEPLGLGDAIFRANKFINNEPFAVLLPDEFLYCNNAISDLKKMVGNFKQTKDSQILVEKISSRHSKNYGIVDISKSKEIHNSKKIIKLKEKPRSIKTRFSFRIIGRYVLSPKIMKYLGVAQPTKDGEIQLTDSLQKMSEENSNLRATLSSSKVYDCGSLKGLLGANIALASKDPKMKKYIKEILN